LARLSSNTGPIQSITQPNNCSTQGTSPSQAGTKIIRRGFNTSPQILSATCSQVIAKRSAGTLPPLFKPSAASKNSLFTGPGRITLT
jgi:hypothetical protein